MTNQVGTMSGLTDDCGLEPEGLGIIEYRDRQKVGTLVCSDDHGMEHSGWHSH